MRVLVTGVGSQTGDAVASALASAGMEVRALVHRPERAEAARRIGASEVIVGDSFSDGTMAEAMDGVSSAYLICPAFDERETELVRSAVRCAGRCGCDFIVYHSVLHPNLPDLRHHARKLASEAVLAESGMGYAVLQPAILMQNLTRQVADVGRTGQVAHRFYTSDSGTLAMVDLLDVAEVAAEVLSRPDVFSGGTYELVGQNLTSEDVRGAFAGALGMDVSMRYVTDQEFLEGFLEPMRGGRKVREMQDMFHHYCEAGFPGSPAVLRCLLGRDPTTLAEAIVRGIGDGRHLSPS